MSNIALSGYGFGAAIWIPIETTFVNPYNIQAVGSTDKYFEDPRMLENIPKLFLLLGGIFVGLQLVGLLLIFEAPETSKTSKYDLDFKYNLYWSCNIEVKIIVNNSFFSSKLEESTPLLADENFEHFSTNDTPNDNSFR